MTYEFNSSRYWSLKSFLLFWLIVASKNFQCVLLVEFSWSFFFLLAFLFVAFIFGCTLYATSQPLFKQRCFIAPKVWVVLIRVMYSENKGVHYSFFSFFFFDFLTVLLSIRYQCFSCIMYYWFCDCCSAEFWYVVTWIFCLERFKRL